MRPRRRVPRVLLALVAVVCGATGIYGLTQPRPAPAQTATGPGMPGSASAQVARGRQLFVSSCASCHGFDAGGIPDRGPSLRGVGAQSADFYLSTGRMPLAVPGEEPLRKPPAYGRRDIDALVRYVASLGGPSVPRIDPAAGDLADGLHLFTLHCAGCHQVVGRAGIVTPNVVAPFLQSATPTQIAEAVRIGPYVMPSFTERQIGRRDLDSIARYVLWTRDPVDKGGWGLGNIGPIPEGMVAWLLAGVALLIVARLIGERARI